MPKIPALTAKNVVRAFKKAGFVEDRQKGSHLVMIHEKRKARVVVPVHTGRTLKKPLLKSIIQDAGLTLEDFCNLL